MTAIQHADRAAWLAWRRDPEAHRIGASEVAIVLGLSPWRQPWELWAERCAPHLVTQQRGAELDDGQRWEPRALAVYAQEHVQPLLSREPMALTRSAPPGGEASYVHPSLPWLHATPDALVCATRAEVWGLLPNLDQIRGLVEIKTDRTIGADAAWPADGTEIGDVDSSTPAADWPVPIAYWLQAQAQIVCAGAAWVDLYVWLPRHSGMPEARRVRVLPHPGFSGVLDVVEAWRARHLVGGEPPPVLDEDDAGRMALVRWRYPEPRGSRPATDEERRLLRRIAARRRRVRDDERAIAVARVALAESMGGTGRIFCPDYGSASRGKRGITVITKEP